MVGIASRVLRTAFLAWSVTALLIAGSAVVVVAAVGGDGTIEGCYSAKNGALRVVDDGARCAKGELAIQWSEQGSAGPQGEQGPQGPAGPQGEPGEPGPAGAGAVALFGSIDTFNTDVAIGTAGDLTLRGQCAGSLFSPAGSVTIDAPVGKSVYVTGSALGPTTVSTINFAGGPSVTIPFALAASLTVTLVDGDYLQLPPVLSVAKVDVQSFGVANPNTGQALCTIRGVAVAVPAPTS